MNTQVKKLIVAMAFPVSLCWEDVPVSHRPFRWDFCTLQIRQRLLPCQTVQRRLTRRDGHWEALLKHAFLTMTK